MLRCQGTANWCGHKVFRRACQCRCSDASTFHSGETRAVPTGKCRFNVHWHQSQTAHLQLRPRMIPSFGSVPRIGGSRRLSMDLVRRCRKNCGNPRGLGQRLAPCNAAVNEVVACLKDHFSGRMTVRRRSPGSSRTRPPSARSQSSGHQAVNPEHAPFKCGLTNLQRQMLLAPRHVGAGSTMAKTLSASRRETPVCELARSSHSSACAGRNWGE